MISDFSEYRKSVEALPLSFCEAILRCFARLERTGQAKRTLLAVCPNSEAVLKASLVAAKCANAPLLIAATLNQVDRDGGYTGWNQKELVQLTRSMVKEEGHRGPVIIGLDHGGPWLKDAHSLQHLSYSETIKEVKNSLEACIEAGYDLLHIDPTVDRELPRGQAIAIETVVERTVELIEHCEGFRRQSGLPRIAYEVGTEEVHGGIADQTAFRKFLVLLKQGLHEKNLADVWPCFVVGKVGTDLHTTEFDPQTAEAIVREAGKYGSFIKGHYTDCVVNPEAYPQTGMGGANVGPEFTAIECAALRDLHKEERMLRTYPSGDASNFFDALQSAVVETGRWKKWLQPDETDKDFSDLSEDRKKWLVETGARYVWADPAVVSARKTLYDNLRSKVFDPGRFVVERIAEGILKYFRAFNLVGSADELEKEFARRNNLPFWGEGNILNAGELIVEIMRPQVDQPLNEPGEFRGPFPSGAPAICCDAAAKYGMKTGFVGAVGCDEFGELILRRFEADGIDTGKIAQVDNLATGCAFVAYFGDGSRKFIFHIGDSASGKVAQSEDLIEYASAFRHCHLMGCSLSVNDAMRSTCVALAEKVKSEGGSVSLDPNLRPEILGIEKCREILAPVISLADIVLPSGDEAELLTGLEDEDKACRHLIQQGVRIVVLKRGANGCRVYSGNETLDVPGFEIDAIDPTGAGDCFDAGFVIGYLKGFSLEEAARLANAMGALGASRLGPMEGTFDAATVNRLMVQQ